jgi:hypothetical protein
LRDGVCHIPVDELFPGTKMLISTVSSVRKSIIAMCESMCTEWWDLAISILYQLAYLLMGNSDWLQLKNQCQVLVAYLVSWHGSQESV